jgi:hypothetical protein
MPGNLKVGFLGFDILDLDQKQIMAPSVAAGARTRVPPERTLTR